MFGLFLTATLTPETSSASLEEFRPSGTGDMEGERLFINDKIG